MEIPGAPPAIAGQIDRKEKHYFVGRKREIRLFHKRLNEASAQGRILNIHGTGGAGKTFLLAEFRRIAEQGQARFMLLDCRTVPRTPEDFYQHVRRLLQPAERHSGRKPQSPALLKEASLGALREAADKQKLVLAFDTFEEFGDTEYWLRDFIAGCDPRILVVISGRLPLRAEWRASPGWEQLIESLPLADLDYEETKRYLSRSMRRSPQSGPDEETMQSLWSRSKGHPLTLSLLAASLRNRSLRQSAFEEADVFAQVVEIWLREVPDAAMRELVETVAVLRHFNQELLAFALQREVPSGTFLALTGYSFVQRSGHGWLLHDLLRDAIHADMRLRAPGHCDMLWQRCIRYYYRMLRQSDSPAFVDNEDWFYYLGDQLIRALFFQQPAAFSVEELNAANWTEAERYIANRHETAKTTTLSLMNPKTREATEFVLTRQNSLDGLRHIHLEELYRLDPSIVKLVRNGQGAVTGLTAIIPINAHTLEYLRNKPLSAPYFSQLPEAALGSMSVDRPFMAGYFVKTLDTYDYADPAMMQASGLILINHMIASGYIVAAPPPHPISKAIFESLGCEREDEPILHDDYGGDAPAPVFVIDLRGAKRRAYLERMAMLSGIADEPEERGERASLERVPTEEELPLSLLTRREREVLDQLLDGRSNQEIASKLYLSEATVKKHLSHIYEKLEVKNRQQLMGRRGKVQFG